MDSPVTPMMKALTWPVVMPNLLASQLMGPLLFIHSHAGKNAMSSNASHPRQSILHRGSQVGRSVLFSQV
jgi:hypothetical protein